MSFTTSPTMTTLLVENRRIAGYAPMQKRIHKYRRDPEALNQRRLTNRSIEIISIIERYRIIPTSFITRLALGNERITARHLQTLYHQGFINRFCFPAHRQSGRISLLSGQYSRPRFTCYGGQR